MPPAAATAPSPLIPARPGLVARYAHWLHLKWPAGRVEPLPVVEPDGSTRVPGLFIVGDLTGIPLLKFSLDSGAKAAQRCARDLARDGSRSGAPAADPQLLDVAIVGAGVAGMAAAAECARAGVRYLVIESSRPFSTVANFPAGKPIFTYPREMRPAGTIQVSAPIKEQLLEELQTQAEAIKAPLRTANALRVERQGGQLAVVLEGEAPVVARRVIVAIGRSGNFRRLGVPGEELGKVSNRLHDPKHHTAEQVLVVGGGDSACEAALALCEAGAQVTLAYRGSELNRPKPDNRLAVERAALAGRLALKLGCTVSAIESASVTLKSGATSETLANQAVLVLIGREAPLAFLRSSGVPIRGDFGLARALVLATGLLVAGLLYGNKGFHWFDGMRGDPATWAAHALAGVAPDSLLGIVLKSASSFGFFITLAYSTVVVIFGIRRIRRRKTPYVTLQTLTLMTIQVLPLFIIPEIILPYLGAHGAFASGLGQTIQSHLFPNGEYWRAYGLILAWPLFVWNIFTDHPNSWWLMISLVQTAVIIPLLIRRWGKGAYCGWICSCGALAETLGDRQREKMPHGPGWNRLNFVGQALLAIALLLLVLRIGHWLAPQAAWLTTLNTRLLITGWKPVVDVTLSGVLGVGLYFVMSGRVWCRFACPLAALMHIYARFSRFRIFPDQKKCISCNACTTACHQGIDVMNFANKGAAMSDPECVRCSACVQVCPTGVLSFGALAADGTVRLDTLAASPVQMREAAAEAQAR